MKDTMFSIIIPLYNTNKLYAEQCIESILTQGYTTFEIIMVDDGSSELNLNLYKKLADKDKRIRLISMGHCGVAAARNVGIKNSTGGWLIFVDSDDWLEPDALTVIAENLAEDTDVLIWNSYKCKNGQKYENPYFREKVRSFSGSEKRVLQQQAIWKYACKDYFPPGNTVGTPWGKAYNRRLFRNKNAEFPTGMEINEDVIFNLYMFEYADSIKYINENLYNYRWSQNSVMNTGVSEQNGIARYMRIQEELALFMASTDNPVELHDAYICRKTVICLELCRLYSGKLRKLNKLCSEEESIKLFRTVNCNCFPEDMKIDIEMLKSYKLLRFSIKCLAEKNKKKLKRLIKKIIKPPK